MDSVMGKTIRKHTQINTQIIPKKTQKSDIKLNPEGRSDENIPKIWPKFKPITQNQCSRIMASTGNQQQEIKP